MNSQRVLWNCPVLVATSTKHEKRIVSISDPSVNVFSLVSSCFQQHLHSEQKCSPFFFFIWKTKHCQIFGVFLYAFCLILIKLIKDVINTPMASLRKWSKSSPLKRERSILLEARLHAFYFCVGQPNLLFQLSSHIQNLSSQRQLKCARHSINTPFQFSSTQCMQISTRSPQRIWSHSLTLTLLKMQLFSRLIYEAINAIQVMTSWPRMISIARLFAETLC